MHTRVVRKIDITSLRPYHFDQAHHIDNPARVRPLTSGEIQMIFETVKSEIELVHDVFGSFETAHRGFKYVEWQASEPPSLPDDTFKFKSKAVNANFKKRRDAGEIIMAPYAIANMKMTYEYGSSLNNRRSLRQQIIKPRSWSSDPWRVISLGDGWMTGNVGAFDLVADSYAYDDMMYSPKEMGWDITLANIRQILAGYHTPDNVLVTAALASANAGKMDILTTLLEIPETVRSVLDGFKMVAKLSKDAKNKEFSLTKRSRERREKLERDLAKKLSEINTKRLGASKHRKNILDNHERKLKRHYRRETERLMSELNSGLASVWMNFRYNIMPNVYAVNDALELIGALYNEYESNREKDSSLHKINIPSGFVALTNENFVIQHKCLVKSRYALNDSMSNRMAAHASANIAQTIWEMTSRSFVVDWFLNIGDFLIALLGIDTSMERLTSYSFKCDQTLAFEDEINHSRVYVTVNNYDRLIINPYDCVSIELSVNLNWLRALDSIAMLWPTIKRLLSSSK